MKLTSPWRRSGIWTPGPRTRSNFAAVGGHANWREDAEAGGVSAEVALGLDLVLGGLADLRHAAGLKEWARGAFAG
jgi:hypothetical protein